MGSVALPLPRRRPSLAPLLRRLDTDAPALTRYALVLLALCAATLLVAAFDPRELDGAELWLKPAKFMLSVAVFALTSAWFAGYVAAAERHGRALRLVTRTTLIAGTLELGYITWQAARGQRSHFNYSSPEAAAGYAAMGVAAVLLLGTTLVLAYAIARYPERRMAAFARRAAVVGLVLSFVLGAGFGGYMAAQAGHFVGSSDRTLPLLGWNATGGDLRVPHFFGVHAGQAIPIIGLAAAAAGEGRRARWAFGVGVLAYVALTVAVFVEAVAGRPFIAL